MKTTITLTPNEVEQILTEYISKNFKIVGKIKLEVGKELTGHYTNEHYETVFKGAMFEVEL